MIEINIIIPARKISNILIKTINILSKQSIRNFIITIVLDKKNYVSDYKFPKNVKLIYLSGTKNMSIKRNYAARKIKSKYLAFLDSDAYPEDINWLKKGITFLKKNEKKNVIICGGPDLSPKKENVDRKLTGILDKSFLISGFRNYRKNKEKSKFVKQLASCNMFIKRSDYIMFGGMKENLYTGEDADLCNRIINKNKKIFYHPSIVVIHLNRPFKSYLFQRIDRSHEAAKATKQFFLNFFINKQKGSYNLRNFRYEFLVNPTLAIYLFIYIFNIFLLRIGILVSSVPIILFFLIILFESFRINKKQNLIFNVFTKLSITVLLQSITNLYFLFFKDNFLKKKYFNPNDE